MNTQKQTHNTKTNTQYVYLFAISKQIKPPIIPPTKKFYCTLMKKENCNQKAKAHAIWAEKFVGKIVRIMYEDAFKHGWKHAEENKKRR